MVDQTIRPARPPAQDEIFAFLGDPTTHGGIETRRLDTHAAAVFLAGERAYKVKRAVRFPFLDYSTLERRKAACQAELEVNQRYAPKLYRRIVPITREPNGHLAFDGQGETIEWAVEMTRFDENQTLDHIAAAGKLDDTLAKSLASAVVAMHEKSERADVAAWLAALDSYIGQNTDAFLERRNLFPAEEVAALERQSRATLAELRSLFLERGRQGLIRRGHGDLHLGNIAVLNGAPVAFDAIEFDPVIASGDVLYDLAFLLMDLVERDLRPTANIVLNGYFAAARRDEDCDGLAALPLFMSLRAAIRAKVTAARLDQCKEADRRVIAASAQHYFALAGELLRPVKPTVICTAGLSGTGKSVLARALAPAVPPVPGALVLRSDVERKLMFRCKETHHLPPEAYRPEASARLYAYLNDKAGRIARAGHSVIVDAVFAQATERSGIERVARDTGATFQGLFLVTDLATRLQRIGGRGPDASDADATVARKQEDFDLGALDWPRVDASGTPADTMARTSAILRRHG
jgi:aminoglycoside phosphotransferase family enzyme/predicted kinase